MSAPFSRVILCALAGLLDGATCRFAYNNNSDVPGAREWNSGSLHCAHSCQSELAQSPIDIREMVDQVVPGSKFAQDNNIAVDWSDHVLGTSCTKTEDVLTQEYYCDTMGMTISARTKTQRVCTTYTLLQLHMHTNSEHAINGKRYDGEMHFVHGNNAGGASTEFLVVGLFLEVTTQDSEVHPFAKKLFGEDGTMLENGTHVLTPGDLLLLLHGPSDPFQGEFHHYKGGFTTPPCTEVVQWFVLSTPLKVRKVTIDLYNKKNTLLAVSGGKFDFNGVKSARPTQNRNNKNDVFKGTTGAAVADKCRKQLDGNPGGPPTRNDAVSKSPYAILTVLVAYFMM
eukprot:GEMP01050855.1.p1 GENE.GEMP01050855.1~~GEMP01050855.1.p1  ORF type:complete len:376 (-),score=73.27 GEMP01050855.1:506-1525(-)